MLLSKVYELFLFRQSKKLTISFALHYISRFCFSRKEAAKQILLMRSNFSFLSVDIWTDVPKCKFILKNSSFKVNIMILHIFVGDTKIIFACNLGPPLRKCLSKNIVTLVFRWNEAQLGLNNEEKQLMQVEYMLRYQPLTNGFHDLKYVRIWVFPDPYIFVQRRNCRFCPYMGIDGSEKTRTLSREKNRGKVIKFFTSD